MRKILIVLAILFSGLQVLAQTSITGTVTDANGEVIPGVNVWVEGNSKVGTITDLNGRFSINLPQGATVLGFSFLGMKTKEVEVGTQTVVNVVLETEDVALGDIVVTALGIKREKKALGYSVQEVSGNEITSTQKTNLVSALEGKVAGVQISSSGGSVGGSTKIVIRGSNSLSKGANNQPLFVVDGVPIDNSTFAGSVNPSVGSNSAGSAGQFSFSNRAIDINPDDIESMSILKGAAATALYGARAANGAVIITTKKGTKGSQIVYTAGFMWSDVNHYPEMQKTWGRGWNADPSLPPTVGTGVLGTFTDFGYARKDLNNEPFYDNMRNFFQTGLKFDNSLAISGGNDKTTYYVSAGLLSQSGIVPNTKWGRKSIKLSINSKVTERFKLGSSINFSNTGGRRDNHGDKSYMSSLLYTSNSFDIRKYEDENGAMISHPYIDNPLYTVHHTWLDDNVNRVNGYLSANYDVSNDIHIMYRIGGDIYSDSRQRVVPGPSVPGEQPLDVASTNGGFIVEERINFQEINSDLILTFKHKFGDDFETTLLLGNNVMSQHYNRLDSRGEGFASPNFYHLSNTTNLFAESYVSNKRIVGFYGDLRFAYKDYLFANFTGRNDISSTLPITSRSYFYPSVNVSFIFTDAFGLESSILSYGKIRGSVAQVGKDTDPYKLEVYYGTNPNFPFRGHSGVTKSNIFGNANLKPERTNSMEIGTDLRFFKNRLGVDFTYYDETTKDMLIDVPVSNASGFSRVVENAGEIENKGIELLLNGTPVKTSNFNWDITLNFSKNKNTVNKLKKGLDEIEIFSFYNVRKLVPGGDYGAIYAYEYLKDDQGKLIISGDGRPTINYDTLILRGTVNPDWTMGITNSFNFKGFQLSFLFDIRHGGLQENDHREKLIYMGKDIMTDYRPIDYVFDGVTATGAVNTTAIQLNRDYYRYRAAYNPDNILESTSWIRLRTISLSYSLRGNLLSKTPFTGIDIALVGNNLFLKTDYHGFDPEVNIFGAGNNASGFSGYATPNTKSYGFNLKLRF